MSLMTKCRLYAEDLRRILARLFQEEKSNFHPKSWLGKQNLKSASGFLIITLFFNMMDFGATCHAGKLSMKWFKANKIRVLKWPGNSSDMDPHQKFVKTPKE